MSIAYVLVNGRTSVTYLNRMGNNSLRTCSQYKPKGIRYAGNPKDGDGIGTGTGTGLHLINGR
jgi:hypothetical protein